MKPLSSTLLAIATFAMLAVALAQTNKTQPVALSKEWPTYGHDAGGMRYSPLTEITPANVDKLKVAWVYHMKPAAPASPRPAEVADADAAAMASPPVK